MNRRKNPIIRVISIILSVVILVNVVGIALNAFTELSAYKNAVIVNAEEWRLLSAKMARGETLTENEYYTVFTQTGLGKSVVENLIRTGNIATIEYYHNYYIMKKDVECVREDFLAHHEYIVDAEGNILENPRFVDVQNGDILITLSMHSYGWRHGHCAIVTDASKGTIAQAVMVGKPTGYGNLTEWKRFPLVAVLRAKNLSAEQRAEVARFVEAHLMGIEYSLFAGVFGGRDMDTIPKSTQCAHFIWYAYKKFGVDIDSNGGTKTTPQDILKSENLEVIQVYGNIMEM